MNNNDLNYILKDYNFCIKYSFFIIQNNLVISGKNRSYYLKRTNKLIKSMDRYISSIKFIINNCDDDYIIDLYNQTIQSLEKKVLNIKIMKSLV